MAHSIELSPASARRKGWLGALKALAAAGWHRWSSGHRGAHLDAETWPDYLLRDVGLSRAARPHDRPDRRPMNWR